eukprot:CFRG2527T1
MTLLKPSFISKYDVVIVGGGHNGLCAAAYLSKAGRSVLVLERLDNVGGAAVSTRAFEGVDANLSRYSYLVSLLPKKIIKDLGLKVELRRRRFSSYTPVPGNPSLGLLVDNNDSEATIRSFTSVGEESDSTAFNRFYERTRELATAVWPTVTEPLLTRSEMKALLDNEDLWNDFIDQPLSFLIERDLAGDVSRGVVLSDGLIGTFARASEKSLLQNRCFLYHVIGNGTGDWDIPVGGMGTVTAELHRVAKEAGTTILTGAEVTSILYTSVPTPNHSLVYTLGGEEKQVQADWVLANCSSTVLSELLREPQLPLSQEQRWREEGAQIKVNIMLKRLPRLLDTSITAEAAFGGTFHINETYTQLDRAYLMAKENQIPNPLPCEIYCHSLADNTILGSDLQKTGAHTLTAFGLHTPHSLLTRENNDDMRHKLVQAVLDSIDSVLAEPLADLVLKDANGQPCVEGKTTLDLEDALNMTSGNIFHGALSWPFVEEGEDLSTAPRRWGVHTIHSETHPRVILCGAGARRGGAVSAIGGHNAAMAVLET